MNTKMKLLSLALVGLCGFAGSAMAACPAGPTTADGGAWSSASILPPSSSAVAIGTPGLDTSECKMTSSLGPSISASATVRDDTPNAEPRYRFQFLVDTTALSSFSATDNVAVFQTPATTTANGLSRTLRLSLVAGPAGAKRLRVGLSCASDPSFVCAQTYGTDLIAGVNRIEGDMTISAAGGQVKLWVNAAAGTTEPGTTSLTVPATAIDNSAWGGVDAATLGLTAPSAAFKNNHASQAVGFDTFDSRRSTYIGW
jgi:hypothetical protein